MSQLPNINTPRTTVLEAPFTNLAEAIVCHPFAYIYKWIPWFNSFFVEPLLSKDTHFDSLSSIGKVKSPLLILHAMDDKIIPYSLGHKLYEAALKSRVSKSSNPVKMVSFDASHGYGHKNIYMHNELPKILHDFIN